MTELYTATYLGNKPGESGSYVIKTEYINAHDEQEAHMIAHRRITRSTQFIALGATPLFKVHPRQKRRAYA